MPVPTKLPSVVVLGGELYVFGGTTDWTKCEEIRSVQIYDPKTDQWRPGIDLSAPRYLSAAAIHDGNAYVFGGYGPGRRILDYNEKLNTKALEDTIGEWLTRSPIPTPRGALVAETLSDGIHLVGGSNADDNFLFTAHEVYDPATDTWTAKAPAPDLAVWGPASAVVNGKLYVIGGWSGGHSLRQSCPLIQIQNASLFAVPALNQLSSNFVLEFHKVYYRLLQSTANLGTFLGKPHE